MVCAFLLLWKRAGIYVWFHSELGNVSVHETKKYWGKLGNQNGGNPVLSWEKFCTASFQDGSLFLAVGLYKCQLWLTHRHRVCSVVGTERPCAQERFGVS